MILRAQTHRNGGLKVFVVVLALSFLLLGTGMAGSRPGVCRAGIGPVRVAPMQAAQGKCACCPGEKEKPCAGLKAGCASPTGDQASASTFEPKDHVLKARVFGIEYGSLPSSTDETGPGITPGRQIVYLINANLLC